jgi:hypothetical protein
MKAINFASSLNVFLFELFAQNNIDSIISESDLQLKTSTGEIYGILTVSNNDKSSPIVLIIGGSGPTDRNCNSPMGLQTNALKCFQ